MSSQPGRQSKLLPTKKFFLKRSKKKMLTLEIFGALTFRLSSKN